MARDASNANRRNVSNSRWKPSTTCVTRQNSVAMRSMDPCNERPCSTQTHWTGKGMRKHRRASWRVGNGPDRIQRTKGVHRQLTTLQEIAARNGRWWFKRLRCLCSYTRSIPTLQHEQIRTTDGLRPVRRQYSSHSPSFHHGGLTKCKRRIRWSIHWIWVATRKILLRAPTMEHLEWSTTSMSTCANASNDAKIKEDRGRVKRERRRNSLAKRFAWSKHIDRVEMYKDDNIAAIMQVTNASPCDKGRRKLHATYDGFSCLFSKNNACSFQQECMPCKRIWQEEAIWAPPIRSIVAAIMSNLSITPLAVSNVNSITFVKKRLPSK